MFRPMKHWQESSSRRIRVNTAFMHSPFVTSVSYGSIAPIVLETEAAGLLSYSFDLCAAGFHGGSVMRFPRSPLTFEVVVAGELLAAPLSLPAGPGR